MNTLKLLSLCIFLIFQIEGKSQEEVQIEHHDSINLNVVLNNGMAYVVSVDTAGNILAEHFSIPDYFESDYDDAFYISQVAEEEMIQPTPQLFSKKILATRKREKEDTNMAISNRRKEIKEE